MRRRRLTGPRGPSGLERLPAWLLAAGLACEAPPEPRPAAPPVVATPPAMTAEELAEARRKAGFKDDDLAAEKALTREHGARVHVKANLAAYRALARGLERSVADIERSAKRWARTSDPQRSYRRWREQRARMAANLTEQHRALRREADDGRTQALIERTFRQWEDLLNDLGGDVAGQARFAALVAELRASLTAVDAALDEIDHDDELEEVGAFEPG